MIVTKQHRSKDILLYNAISNTMLYFYMTIAYSEMNYSSIKRTELLIKKLKFISNLSKYKEIKRDIRSLIKYGRTNKFDLENKMNEIQSYAEKLPINAKTGTDLFLFTELLALLNIVCKVDDTEAESAKALKTSAIYLERTSLSEAFDDDGYMKNGIALYVPLEKEEPVFTVCKTNGWEVKKDDMKYSTHFVAFLRRGSS